ncbi:cytochrome o ubiquinol oxidase subunit IV [Tropicibacter sp. Alg240-R139]|uniref:cytochrome o ubiquinol oxidase subunit IV n=1 Tax=Tropicibacter sp. Alg240-R139 TaxID=2305991 RepID=UPI0013E0C01C|nr:cytochrome o ubiquinol oxidase subunit IV [Tropicibacter sp. Alg240-R139]
MREMPTIVIGFCLAVILTALPFAVVIGQWLPRESTLWLIAVAAVLQIMVHLHFFLGVGFSSKHRERLTSLLFACVLMFIMVGGTLWVMTNLYWRMM